MIFKANQVGFPYLILMRFLGMDWLHSHRARIDCLQSKTHLKGPKKVKVTFKGARMISKVELISAIMLVKNSVEEENYFCVM